MRRIFPNHFSQAGTRQGRSPNIVAEWFSLCRVWGCSQYCILCSVSSAGACFSSPVSSCNSTISSKDSVNLRGQKALHPTRQKVAQENLEGVLMSSLARIDIWWDTIKGWGYWSLITLNSLLYTLWVWTQLCCPQCRIMCTLHSSKWMTQWHTMETEI